MTRSTPIAIIIIAAATTGAHADIYTSPAGGGFTGTGYSFEQHADNDAISRIDFGNGVIADITTNGNPYNSIFDTHDGHGAVSADGSKAWKIGNGASYTFDFGTTSLNAFGFWYSDLEWSDMDITFDNGDAFRLSDNNSMNAKFWGYRAEPGQGFSTVTFDFTNGGDGVGIDGMFVQAVPAPASIAIGTAAIALACGRRRR